MKRKHRKLLNDTLDYCNELGCVLDGTSTHESKYKDRQRALMDVYHILYAVVCDRPQNDHSDYDYERAYKSLENLKALKEKCYPDRVGNY